ncbi:Ser/Thr protein kinase RdoA involved in Cpx stress response, MazF antagonist [Streptomyces sp. LamerLS-316]|uniref:phosphotransferase n=1 Tax=unclassified Streptomyces TaxID=2593676 RepID=UPI000823C789|nr:MULTISPECIES: phosphotransferase [unclassified Streptomyces]MYQ40758.1 phosphotransferase [Streptomyces sp. SID4921]SCK05245.1 Ser/Thr protein kinase RdoA involved in Cpx stress response, MazF antagonist [Streptomyces sp. LamerLS-316]
MTRPHPVGLLDPATHAWLTRHALPGALLHEVAPLSGGFTNDMTLLTVHHPDAAGAERYVLRHHRPCVSRFPRNSCEVEIAVLSRAAARAVPVSAVVAADPQGHVTGRPALLYRFVEGVPLSQVLAEGPGSGEAQDLGRAVGMVLARIGRVRLPRPGVFADSSLVPNPDSDETLDDLPGFVERCLVTGAPDGPLSGTDSATLRALARRGHLALTAVAGERHLVHGDFNPKNVLVQRRAGQWAVTAVLDWELAFSGSPLFDVGNILRFAHEYPPAFTTGFLDGFRGGNGRLPADWLQLSRTLDLFALADILTAPPDRAYFARVRTALRRSAAG